MGLIEEIRKKVETGEFELPNTPSTKALFAVSPFNTFAKLSATLK
jgi:hypothetical protein